MRNCMTTKEREGATYGERLAAIEAQIPYLATKADLERLQLWAMGFIAAVVSVVVGVILRWV